MLEVLTHLTKHIHRKSPVTSLHPDNAYTISVSLSCSESWRALSGFVVGSHHCSTETWLPVAEDQCSRLRKLEVQTARPSKALQASDRAESVTFEGPSPDRVRLVTK